MTFQAPLNLLWLLPALGAIVALYLLRRPRRNLVVPSTIFWRIMPEQSVRATRLQRFTPQLLFFLQALAALLLIGAAAHPSIRSEVAQGRTWAIIIDNGGSMNATDVRPSRLSEAVSRAQEIVQQLPATDQVILISTANVARVILPVNSGRAKVITSLAAVQPTDAHSDIVGAVSAASSALKTSARADRIAGILVFSDGAWEQSEDSAIDKAAEGLPLQFVQVSTANAPNIAVSRLTVVRDPSSPNTTLSVLVQIDSHAHDSRPLRLVLTVGGREVSQKMLRLPANASEQANVQIDAPAQQSILTARIAGQGTDDLSDDDVSSTVLPAAGKTRILLICNGDPPLERALSLLPGIALDEVPASANALALPPAGYAAYVFDGIAPPPLDTVPGNVIVFGGKAPDFVATQEAASNISQPIVTWNRSHPINRFVDFSNTHLVAQGWQTVGSWTPLIETQEGTVAAVRERLGRRDAWFSFTPQASGLSSQIAFPILVSNLVDWLTQASSQSDVAGTPIALVPERSGWSVSGPNRFAASGICNSDSVGCTVTDTLAAGVYTARSSNETLLLARNVDPGCSEMRPQAHQFIEADLFQRSGGTATLRMSWSDITGFAAAFCLLLLVLEWWVYHRPAMRAARSQTYRG